jgi:hypothetical protein
LPECRYDFCHRFDFAAMTGTHGYRENACECSVIDAATKARDSVALDACPRANLFRATGALFYQRCKQGKIDGKVFEHVGQVAL